MSPLLTANTCGMYKNYSQHLVGGVTRNLGDGRLGSKSSGIWEIGVQKIRDLGDWGKIWDKNAKFTRKSGRLTKYQGDGRLGSKKSGIWEIGVQKIRDMGD